MPYKVKKLTPIDTSSLSSLGRGVVDLSKYTEDEFASVARSMQATEPDQIWNVAPPKPRRGTTVYADGTNWNPGSGEGPYYFDSTNTWRSMGGASSGPGPATVPPLMDGTAAVGTSLLYARQDHVHPTDTSRAPTASPTFTGTATFAAATFTSASVSGNAVMTINGGATLTGGFNVTPSNQGTYSSGTFTPGALAGNYQYYTNNGAHTLAAPSSDCAIDILVTNGASAGAITFSGFTVGANTGDPLTTTNTNKFIISIRRINAISTYTIKALQ